MRPHDKPSPDSLDTEERLARTYARPPSEVEIRVGSEVFGDAASASTGFTTASQADELLVRLRLASRDRLLEIGTGRGWPGVFLAERCGCEIVLSDLPPAAARQALENTREAALAAWSAVVGAHGAALPFRSWSFDAVVHSDVLC